MREYLNPTTDFDDLSTELDRLKRSWYGFDPIDTRRHLLGLTDEMRAQPFSEAKLRRFVYKPFDFRFAYLEPSANLWVAPQRSLVRHSDYGSRFLYVRRTAESADDGAPIFFSSAVGDQHSLHKTAYLIPTIIAPELDLDEDEDASEQTVITFGDDPKANLSGRAREYLSGIGLSNPDQDTSVGEMLWLHALAISYAPAYLADNKGAIRQDYPRIPLPSTRQRLEHSVAIGRNLSSLLDGNLSASSVSGLKSLGSIRHKTRATLNPAGGDLNITESWGYVDNRKAIMAGMGRTTLRDRSSAERVELESEATARGLSVKEAEALLGEQVLDIYLNEHVYWSNVPLKTWKFRIGGFQVLKKWLSYRQIDVLGRGLTSGEARFFSSTCRCLTEMILVRPTLDENYRQASSDVWPWVTPEEADVEVE